MLNTLNINNAESKIDFPFAVAKAVKKDFPSASGGDQLEMVSSVLTNNNVRHSLVNKRVVVHDLRIMDDCCEFAWYENIEAIAVNQMSSDIPGHLIGGEIQTIVSQEGAEIFPVYKMEGDVIVMTTVLDELPTDTKEKYQVVYASPCGDCSAVVWG